MYFCNSIPVAFCVIFGILLEESWGVKIVNMIVPRLVENGTKEEVTLDCEYSFSKTERGGIVVKWYRDDDASPVYQWIPTHEPQDLGELKGRVNLNFNVSTDPYKTFRALRIRRPTPELSGQYKCSVSSFVNEASMSRNMLVYAPPSEVAMDYNNPSPDKVNISCTVHSVYPAPEIHLFQEHSWDIRSEIPDPQTIKFQTEDALTITLFHIFLIKNLPSVAIFECDVVLRPANYNKRVKLQYYPGKSELRTLPPTEPPLSTPAELMLPNLLTQNPYVLGNKSVRWHPFPSLLISTIIILLVFS